jgi:hypothetical protein
LFLASTLVILPLTVRKFGRWSSLALLPLLYFYFHLLLAGRSDWHDFALLLDALGLATAVALYVLAGHWPPLPTASLWTLPSREQVSPAPKSDAGARGRGWPVLLLDNLLIALPIWAVLMLGVPLVTIWAVPDMDIRIMALILSLAPLQWATASIAPSMRVFRALPYSTTQLTLRLALLLMLVQALSMAGMAIVLWLGHDPYPPAMFALMLAYPLFYFALMLRFPRLIPLGMALSIFLTVPLQLAALVPQIWLWLFAAAPVAAAAGLLWMRHAIARGRHTYHIQPQKPARWRGGR